MVKDISDLDRYPWCGHSVLMGTRVHPWQECDYVLSLFGRTQSEARKAYRKYVEQGLHIEELRAGSRRAGISLIRSELALKLLRECGLSLAEIGRQLGVTTSAVSKPLRKGEGTHST